MSQAALFAEPAQEPDTRRCDRRWTAETYPAIVFLRHKGIRVTRRGKDHVLGLMGSQSVASTHQLHQIARSMGWKPLDP